MYLLVVALGYASTGWARGKPPPCPGGDFTLEGGDLIPEPGSPAVETIRIDNGTAEIVGWCGPTSATLRRNKTGPAGTRVLAKWPTCGTANHVMLKALIKKKAPEIPACALLAGKVSVKKSRARHFRAERATAGTGEPGGGGDGGGGSSSADQFAFPISSAVPFQVMELGTSSLPREGQARVRLFNGTGYSITVAAVKGNPVEIIVPPYTDPSTLTLAEGAVTAEVLFPDGATHAVAGSLTIAAPPEVPGPPGRLTLAFMKGLLNLSAAAQRALVGLRGTTTVIGLHPLEAFLYDDANAVRAMVGDLDTNLAVGAGPIPIGMLHVSDGTVPLRLDADSLAVTDRVIAALIAQLRFAGPALPRFGPLGAVDSDETVAENLLADLAENHSQSALDAGKRIASLLGKAVAVASAVALLAGATTAATGLAVTGGFVYLASTWAPAAISVGITAGARAARDESLRVADLAPAIEYTVSSTVTADLKFIGGEEIERAAGPTGAGMFALVDEATDFTQGIGDAIGRTVRSVVEAPSVSLPSGSRSCEEAETVDVMDFSQGVSYCYESAFGGRYSGSICGDPSHCFSGVGLTVEGDGSLRLTIPGQGTFEGTIDGDGIFSASDVAGLLGTFKGRLDVTGGGLDGTGSYIQRDGLTTSVTYAFSRL